MSEVEIRMMGRIWQPRGEKPPCLQGAEPRQQRQPFDESLKQAEEEVYTRDLFWRDRIMQKNNTMGLDFSVSCATFHPTCRKVETQYMSLMNLLDSVSSNMEKQYLDDEKSGYEWAKKSAKESSGGEEILYQYIYGQNCAAVDGHLSDLYDIQNMFYKSMLSTVYSYYESILTLIVVEESLGDKQKPFDALKDKVYSKLQSEVKIDFDYLYDTIRLIRNIITHNYNGTPSPDQIRAAQTETEQKRKEDSLCIIKRVIL